MIFFGFFTQLKLELTNSFSLWITYGGNLYIRDVQECRKFMQSQRTRSNVGYIYLIASGTAGVSR